MNDYVHERLDNCFTPADHKLATLLAAFDSDNPTVESAFDALLVSTRIAHAEKVAYNLLLIAHDARMNMSKFENIDALDIYKLVQRAFKSQNTNVLAALENFVDVATSATYVDRLV